MIKNIDLLNKLIVQPIYLYLPFSGYDLYTVKIVLSCKAYEEISGRLPAALSSEKVCDELKRVSNYC